MSFISMLIHAALLIVCSNVFAFTSLYTKTLVDILLIIFTVIFTLVTLVYPCSSKEGGRLGRLKRGYFGLEIFLITVTADIALAIYFGVSGKGWKLVLINSLIAFVILALVFAVSITRAYISSVQLGVKWRILGVCFAFIPPVNIILLFKIIKLSRDEYILECQRLSLDRSRAGQQICATRYPILMVHGVFFRDVKFFNYWGRIPEALEKNGAKVFYGSQQSADSVKSCAAELKAKIDEIVERDGCEKVNIIAHSKGGLDSRYAISLLGADERVASLTTVNTPHRGCQFADYLLSKAPEGFKNAVANKYNAALKRLGDSKPDFIAAVTDLTASACEELNKICPDKAGVYYQSIGSRSVRASGGRFPLNLSYHLVNYFDGANDGLVSVDAMKWGEAFTFLEPTGRRGISHGDVIDLNRENIKGFDVREFYVGVVQGLKNKGL